MHPKEVLLREWYNLGGGALAPSKDLSLQPELLLETESEQEDDNLLLQSDSEADVAAACAPTGGSEDLLLATDSEDGHSLEAAKQKAPLQFKVRP